MLEDRLLVLPAERLTFAAHPGGKVLVNLDFPNDKLGLLQAFISPWSLLPPKPGQLRERYFVRPTRPRHQSARLHPSNPAKGDAI